MSRKNEIDDENNFYYHFLNSYRSGIFPDGKV